MPEDKLTAISGLALTSLQLALKYKKKGDIETYLKQLGCCFVLHEMQEEEKLIDMTRKLMLDCCNKENLGEYIEYGRNLTNFMFSVLSAVDREFGKPQRFKEYNLPYEKDIFDSNI